MKKRGNVWLGAAGLVIDPEGRWLVVNKRYGGLKDTWSMPAGFVNPDETADEAAVREVLEETGIHAEIQGLIGIRSGVIRGEISDNMIIFLMKPLDVAITPQQEEIYEARFMDPDRMIAEGKQSLLLEELWSSHRGTLQTLKDGRNPGDQFGYTAYKLFL